MRTGSSDIDRRTAHRRVVLPLALLVLASLCLLAVLAGGAPAESLQDKFQHKQAQLSHVQAAQGDLSATIADQNRQIDSLIGQVADARAQAADVARKLAAKQAELQRARAQLARQRHHLQVVRARLQRALAVLRGELVRIYEAGDPDTLSVILNSASWSDVVAQSDYLDAYQHHFDSVVERVRALRDQTRLAVKRLRAARDRLQEARDAIAAQKRQIDRTRATLEQRRNDLVALRQARQRQLDALESRGQALSDNLASISDQIQSAQGGPSPAAPAPLAPGEQAQLLSNGDAAAPASAPAAVKAVIAAANQIDTTPYVWGGGHGSFSSSGYDCSGAVSFALNGGGFLSSPLDSTGLETWGSPGPGRWITVYANSGHAFAVIAGLSWDTVGDVSGTGPRWHTTVESTAGFIARHPSGY
jgi:septal ring factor EnvC (AmiA/AmiB activator)